MSSNGREAPFRLGCAEIDPASREVSFGGRRERIQDKPLCVLLLLHRRLGQVVTRDDIVDQCWDGRIVGDDVINRAVSILRKLAGRAGGFRIETIPRAGYRLIEVDSAAAPGRARRTWGIMVAAAILAGVAVGMFATSRRPTASAVTVSILPVTSAGGPDARHLADRLGGVLSTALTEAGVQVVPAGRSPWTVSGAVTGEAGTMRVDMAVILRSGRKTLMTRVFESPRSRAQNLDLQVATAFAETMSVMGPLLALDGRDADPVIAARMFMALDAALQGNALRAYEITLRTSREHPDSISTQMALAITSGATLESFSVPERREHVRIAREILEHRKQYAPRFPDYGHAWCLLRPRSWLADCERQLRATLDDEVPGNSSAQRLSELTADVGRIEEAAMLARVAAARHAHSADDIGVLLQLLETEGRHREAEAVFADAVRKWPSSWALRWNRIVGLAARGDFASLERFAATIPRSDFTFDAEVLQSVLTAYRRGDRAGMIRLCTQDNLRGSTRQLCIAALAAIGELNTSFAIARDLYPNQVGRTRAEDEAMWLEQPAYFTVALLSANAGAPLRRDPRFVQLAEQIGLLRYWRTGKLPDFCTRGRPEPVCAKLKPAG
ncbi:winged helix-turn-helix transcriptional regulator [Sphingomonas lutea]|uniref:Winged helix-turn-helix transcriptional regulator n=2 Tax=Sphingomonas lutea TaxID=1045317 RepID=A0A7G9SHR9_9SPHN|nr:winged helix-turn-helix transcriptional regulator [Sphingomonas lutea]